MCSCRWVFSKTGVFFVEFITVIVYFYFILFLCYFGCGGMYAITICLSFIINNVLYLIFITV